MVQGEGKVSLAQHHALEDATLRVSYVQEATGLMTEFTAAGIFVCNMQGTSDISSHSCATV